jgi:hypothetical protein
MRNSGNKARRYKLRSWLLRRDRKNLRRRQGYGNGGGLARSGWLATNEHTKKSVGTTCDRRVIINLPETLDFEENYERTVSHFDLLRRGAHIGRNLASLRFDKINHISPSAALVLASEVDRWNQLRGGRLTANVDTWHDDIRRLLRQMGYFELLNIGAPPNIDPPKNTEFLRFKRGDGYDRNSGFLAKQLRLEIEALVGFNIKKHLLFEGLSEAITNVGQHAYPDTSFGVKQWWLSASYDREDRRLCVMFYDQGAGIPATLPTSDVVERLREYFDFWPDSKKIEAAMEVGRSATGSSERGKGLQNLVEFAKAHAEGRLSIYSLKGMYRMIASGEGDTQNVEILKRDNTHSINGTLIEWEVKL